MPAATRIVLEESATRSFGFGKPSTSQTLCCIVTVRSLEQCTLTGKSTSLMPWRLKPANVGDIGTGVQAKFVGIAASTDAAAVSETAVIPSESDASKATFGGER